MIGVVIPVHNEELLLGACLAAVNRAAAHPDLGGETVRVVVVLDACSDRSGEIAAAYGALVISIRARNVGHSRAMGATAVIDAGARWLAFTDADTVVSAQWLGAQLAQDADAVCGSIAIDDWSAHSAQAMRRFTHEYIDADGHRHIHGANFGVSVQAYLRAGGFEALRVSEDVALVNALNAIGARIAWSAAPRVVTSARRESRVRGGFGDYLLALGCAV